MMISEESGLFVVDGYWQMWLGSQVSPTMPSFFVRSCSGPGLWSVSVLLCTLPVPAEQCALVGWYL